MTYEEFCSQYVYFIKCGCGNITDEKLSEYSGKIADLVEAYPEYEQRADLDDSLWESLKKQKVN
jgi:hypothetical protein